MSFSSSSSSSSSFSSSSISSGRSPSPLEMLLQVTLFSLGSVHLHNLLSGLPRRKLLQRSALLSGLSSSHVDTSSTSSSSSSSSSSSRPALTEAYKSVVDSKIMWALSNGLVVAKGFTPVPFTSPSPSPSPSPSCQGLIDKSGASVGNIEGSSSSTTSSTSTEGRPACQGLINKNAPSEVATTSSKSNGIALPIVSPAPISLEPYRYPRFAFEKAIELARPFNDIVHMISLDSEWLRDALKQTGETDDFTGRLLRIHEEVAKEGFKQKWCLGIHRSDYMLHERQNDSRNLLQVELNTIASSFGSLSTQVTKMQKIFSDSPESIPTNEVIDKICSSIAAAHRIFKSQVASGSTLSPSSSSDDDCGATCSGENVIVIMVVQDNERNFSDQGLLQQCLLAKHKIICRRETMAYINDNATIDKATGRLYLHGYLVSVVYYRAGYAPTDYLSEKEWSARLLVERSTAIKCPNIGYHLAGTKKIQQVLANPGVLERFFDCSKEENQLIVSKMRSVFAGLYSLDTLTDNSNSNNNSSNSNSNSSAGDPREKLWTKFQIDVVETAIKNPHDYVLKPQREGGNNNVYHEELADMLRNRSPIELSAYILMEKIYAPTQLAVLLRNGETNQVESICELGVYGIYLSCAATREEMQDGHSCVFANEPGGYLLRVKSKNSDEGGVAAGHSVLSCPQLV